MNFVHGIPHVAVSIGLFDDDEVEAVRLPRETVFVIDTSGSMDGTSIEQARAALAQGLAFLGPEDRFNVLEFNSDTRALFEESMPALPWYQEQAVDFIADLEADGGTNMGPALDLAMALPTQDGLLRQIVFVTDGSVGNERELLLQVGERLGTSRLFTVSIGSAPNAWFMRKAAAIGRGSHTRIGQLDEVAERMASLWDRIALPAVQNVCVDWGMEAEFYPEVVPDLYAGEPLWLYARLPLEPGEVVVAVHGNPTWSFFYRDLILALRGELTGEVGNIIASIEDPGKLADLVASNLRLKIDEAQAIIEVIDPFERLKKVNDLLFREVELSTMQAKIQSEVKDEISKNQRDYFLREQMRAIHRELGEADDIVFVDLKMPVMNGMTFLQRIKELLPGGEVIMMTGYADTFTIKDALMFGAPVVLVFSLLR